MTDETCMCTAMLAPAPLLSAKHKKKAMMYRVRTSLELGGRGSIVILYTSAVASGSTGGITSTSVPLPLPVMASSLFRQLYVIKFLTRAGLDVKV
jgi:hypothetical protein